MSVRVDRFSEEKIVVNPEDSNKVSLSNLTQRLFQRNAPEKLKLFS